MGDAVFSQAIDFWVQPEIERRRSSGVLPADFRLFMAQIIWNVGGEVEVRLNHEVRAIAQVRIVRSVAKGELLWFSDFSEIHQIDLTDYDSNAAHLTIILHSGSWNICFDFQYNRSRVAEHLVAAREFLDAAQECLENKRYRVFFENLFAATELTAKAWLLTMPLPKLLKSSPHGYIRSLICAHARLGNFSWDYVKLCNALNKSRDTARYLNGAFEPNQEVCSKLLNSARVLFTSVNETSPAPYKRCELSPAI